MLANARFTLGTFVFVPIGEIRLPHDKLAVPQKKQQGVIVPAVMHSGATYVRRMIRQAASDRQYPFQKLWRNPQRFDRRSPFVLTIGRGPT
jgi:hypothetical protein